LLVLLLVLHLSRKPSALFGAEPIFPHLTHDVFPLEPRRRSNSQLITCDGGGQWPGLSNPVAAKESSGVSAVSRRLRRGRKVCAAPSPCDYFGTPTNRAPVTLPFA